MDTTTTTASETLAYRPYNNMAPRTLVQLQHDLKALGFESEFVTDGLHIKQVSVEAKLNCGRRVAVNVFDYLTPYYFWYGITYADITHRSLIVAHPNCNFCASPAQLHHMICETLRVHGAPDDIEIFTERTRVWVQKTPETSRVLSTDLLAFSGIDVEVIHLHSGMLSERVYYVVRANKAVQF